VLLLCCYQKQNILVVTVQQLNRFIMEWMRKEQLPQKVLFFKIYFRMGKPSDYPWEK
jgi:hypothetical protein